MRGGMAVEFLLPLGYHRLHFVYTSFTRGNPFVERRQLVFELSQLAAAGDQSAGTLSRADDKRAVGLQVVTGQCNEIWAINLTTVGVR